EAVVAESYARIFYRNAVNGGFLLPFELVESVWQRVKTGDELEIHVSTGTLRNLTAGESYALRPLGDVIGILEAGDVFAYAKQAGLLK
ncbi:MAG: 3-isopropylmalate dehydratase, partial [Nitrospiraceae bacterium]